MNIVTALETLAVEGMEGDHDHVIETVLSKLFVRGEEVHKAYKHRVADFTDLTLRETRRAYIGEDFFWNNTMSPDVYRELRAVRRDGEQFVHTSENDAEDWYIVMKKVDTTKDLMRHLEHGSLSEGLLAEYVRTLLPRLEALTSSRQKDLERFFERGTTHIHEELIGATGWAHTATPHIASADVFRAEELLRSAIKEEPYFQTHIETVSVVTDVNAENILFVDGDVSFIDVMPPKDAWRVHDKYFVVCRTSADVSTLTNVDSAEILHVEYGKVHPLPSPIVRAAYEIAATLIQVPYRKMVGHDTLAEKYAQFLRRRSDDLERLLQAQN